MIVEHNDTNKSNCGLGEKSPNQTVHGSLAELGSTSTLATLVTTFELTSKLGPYKKQEMPQSEHIAHNPVMELQ